MASLHTMPYDLLFSIAQYLDLADIYALQLVRVDGFVPSDRQILNSCLFNRLANISVTRFAPDRFIEAWLSASSSDAARSRYTVSSAFPIYLRINWWRW
jgi:hypothetical protein